MIVEKLMHDVASNLAVFKLMGPTTVYVAGFVPSGGGGNRTRVPKQLHASFYVCVRLV
jgi:hypothetical protein